MSKLHICSKLTVWALRFMLSTSITEGEIEAHLNILSPDSILVFPNLVFFKLEIN